MWLLEPNFERELRARLKSVGQISATAHTEFATHSGKVSAAEGQPRNLKLAGDVAEISVKGVLTNKLDFWLWLFGYEQTTYDQINSSLAIAAADPNVKRVVLFIDSPGGTVAGLFDTFAALDAFPKQKSVRASLAASAAYGIAALGGKIEATNPTATFGSVGVVATYLHDEELIEITSTEAPDKRPDPSTDEGKAVIREYLDAIHELFAEAIARGRGTTVEDVNTNFGRGAVLVAADAKKRGMIDKAPPALRAVNTKAMAEAEAEPEPPTAAPGAAHPMRKVTMIKEEFKSQHPDLYEAVRNEGKAEGEKTGAEAAVKQERDRVEAFLVAGENSGDMKTAIAAIRSGDEMTMAYMTRFMFSGKNKADIETRQDESDAAGAAVDNAAAAGAANAKDIGDNVAELMAKKRGKKL